MNIAALRKSFSTFNNNERHPKKGPSVERPKCFNKNETNNKRISPKQESL